MDRYLSFLNSGDHTDILSLLMMFEQLIVRLDHLSLGKRE
jgi:hypothetical protein